MMTIRMDAYFLECLCGEETIVLPSQSPLGIYEGLQYRPTGVWPIELVCTRLGRQFERSRQDIQFKGTLSKEGQNKHSPVLWQIERKCGRERCPKSHAIFLWYAGDATQEEIGSEILRATPRISCGDTEIALSLQWMKISELV